MNFAWSYLFVLIWLAYMIGSGVLLFSRGFLLSRVSKTEISSCRRLSTNPGDEYFITEQVIQEIFKDVNATSDLCLPQKSKVIILVIDALKYEFGIYKENITDPLPFENKLTIMHDLLQAAPEQAHLMRFKADPPTTTMQRLKGLTTGSLPTFVDIGSNFASPEINEDNIIDQLAKNNMSMVFLGDSTWTDLYPHRFKRAYSYPSFDIFDLDTVDRKIKRFLPAEIAKDDWEVLIAHFLGVDHCGHKHGPLHEEMERKLREMNEVIKSVIEEMDSDTTLLVMGDHGMTASGDHGGESDDETNALLFAYTKGTKFVGSAYGSDNTTMQQIDLVPTLATILGVPIPYSNLGLINFNIVPDIKVPHLNRFQTLLLHAWQNAQQIFKYFFQYALENKRTFNVDEMDRMETEYILLSHRVKTIYNEVAFKSFIGDLNAHLRLILNTCREIWVKFDATQMSQGLLITFLPIFFAFLLINNSRAIELYTIFTPKEVLYTYLLNIAAGVFGYRYYRNFSFKTEEHGIIFFTNISSTFVLVYHTVQHWSKIATNWSAVKRFGNFPTRLIVVISVSVYFSNSFVIQEAKILSYLLVACIVLLAYEVLQKSVRVDFKTRFKPAQFMRSTAFKLLLVSILAIVFIRFAYALFRCREEQGNCADFTNVTTFSLKKPAAVKIYLLGLLSIVLYTTMTRVYLRTCGNLTGSSWSVVLARYGPTIAAIAACGHMLLANSQIKNIKRAHIDAIALVIYALFVLQIIAATVSPLLVHLMAPKSDILEVSRFERVIPEIFKKMKRMYEGDENARDPKIPVLYGLATVYSATVIVSGIFLSKVLILILEPKPTIGMVICMGVATVILMVHSILRYRTATSFDICLQPTFTAIVSWFLLAHFCFFATSHQTTLSQINWRAAFVGRTSGIGRSQLISGLLVILNTFCGPVLFFFTYTLLSTGTFSLFAIFPHAIKTNHNRENRKLESVDPRTATQNGAAQRSMSDISLESVGFDITRGELALYENHVVYLSILFRLAVQFLMLQGVKVFCAMLACTIHCRHLMVWKIFAPRFIYEALATFVSLAALILGYLLVLRVHRALGTLFSKIEKRKYD